MSALDKLCTPPNVLELVRKVGDIGFDPFPGEHSLVSPTARVTLIAKWQREGFDAWKCDNWLACVGADEVLFCNPPYSRGNLPRFADHWSKQDFFVQHGIALLPSSTGARWFDVMCRSSKVLLLWRGRITFWLDGKPTKGGGMFDSALFYNGANPYRFADVFAPFGRVVML